MQKLVVGHVRSGGGAGRGWVARNEGETKALLGVDLYPGTLYVVLKRPFLISDHAPGITDVSGIVPIKVNGRSAYLKKSKIEKPNTCQLLSDVHLRTALKLSDGDEVRIEIDDRFVRDLTWAEYFEIGGGAKAAKWVRPPSSVGRLSRISRRLRLVGR